MSFVTTKRMLQASEEPFEQHTRIEVDLSGVERADSAGLALLLERITRANHAVCEIRFTHMPDRFLAIAKTTEVDNLLERGERWPGLATRQIPKLGLFVYGF